MKLITEKSEKKETIWKSKNININIREAVFELDVLQLDLIQRYLRNDRNFMRAFFTDYTKLFFQFLKDKTSLNEPIHLSVMGAVRSSKSTSAICIAGMIMEARDKLMDTNHIMQSEYAFLETLKENKNVSFGDCFVIDESKQAVFGIGSSAKKLKIADVQNIIAVNNISTIWVKPDGWSFEGAMYGLRAFGRGQFDKQGNKLPIRINRFMLYNLQESSAGGSLPLGMVYIPHFADYLKNGKELLEAYNNKKQDWVNQEQFGTSDSLQESMFRMAERLSKSEAFSKLTKSKDKETFIATALGSEATRGEITQLLSLTRLLAQGYTLENIREAVKG